jgi:hypothetical protein
MCGVVEVSLMYRNEEKDLMFVFDNRHRLLATVRPEWLFRCAQHINPDKNVALISMTALKVIATPIIKSIQP